MKAEDLHFGSRLEFVAGEIPDEGLVLVVRRVRHQEKLCLHSIHHHALGLCCSYHVAEKILTSNCPLPPDIRWQLNSGLEVKAVDGQAVIDVLQREGSAALPFG